MQHDKRYLLDRQRNIARLKRVAIEEFVQARNSGRLVAFVGSYASEHLGYPSWTKLVDDFFTACAVDPAYADLFERLKLRAGKRERQFENTDHMDLGELLANRDRHTDPDAFGTARTAFAKNFVLRGRVEDALARPSIAKTLFEELKVSRAVTLNYDLELEWAMFMTAQDLKGRGAEERAETWARMLPKWQEEAAMHLHHLPRSKVMIERHVPGRGKVVSDVLDREDSAQLIEFALGAPDEDHGRILHLHGRADCPDAMLVTRRDYRDRYWQDGFSRLPFEYGLRLIFTGNPVIYVGIGMAEAEVTRTLEQMLSDNPNRRAVPMFLLWESSGTSPRQRHDDDVTRLLFNRKFGVHVLFDHEVAALNGDEEAYRKAIRAEAEAVTLPIPDDMPLDPKLIGRARRVDEPLRRLSSLSDDAREQHDWRETDFRNPQAKYDCKPKDASDPEADPDEEAYPDPKHRVNIWCYKRERVDGLPPPPAEVYLTRKARPAEGEPDTPELESSKAADLLARQLREGPAIQAMIGEPASRRGAVASCIGGAFERFYVADAKAGRVVVVNGSFATDTDSIFSILSGAFDGETAWKAGLSRAKAMVRLQEQIDRQLSGGVVHALGKALRDAMPADRAILDSLGAGDRRRIEEAEGKFPADAPSSAAGAPKEQRELTLIINGMERFFAHDGSALSAELDSLIRLVIAAERRFQHEHPHILDGHFLAYDRAREALARCGIKLAASSDLEPPAFPVRLILIGTSRLQRYLSTVAPAAKLIDLRIDRDGASSSFTIGDDVYEINSLTYFAKLMDKFPGVDKPVGAEPSLRRRNFLAGIFDAIAADDEIDNPELAFEILRTLAFIGQPTEQHVLNHVPNLRDAPALSDARRAEIAATIAVLVERGLILHIAAFPNCEEPRLALHKTLVTELRQRFGVPVSDAKLAAGFNMGLYTAQPLDIFTPEQRWHEEIGQMVDFLAAQYKDEQFVDPAIQKCADSIARRHNRSVHLRPFDALQLGRLASPAMANCLRAALSLMRSYYSTPALLMYGNRELDPWNRNGPLTEHADRLRRLIRIARSVAAARREVGAKLTGKVRGRLLGPAPLYPDDLAWIINELGVVRITQGDLYTARPALEEARRLNDRFVDFFERHQNWRRISLNLVQVDIECARIEPAEQRLRDIEDALESEAARFAATAPFAKPKAATTLRDYVVATYAHGACSSIGDRIDALYPTDLILGIALVLGYRGLCLHLRGALTPALEAFQDALAILERLNEQRAYAFFQRHHAALLAATGKMPDAIDALRLCVAAAGPSRQTDIDHAGRIALAPHGFLIPLAEEPKRAGPQAGIIPQLKVTLRYATTSDMYRLQIEAMQYMAIVHLSNGDADSAMQFATDALAIATRCGFGLRKVSLRILVGRILVFRRDRESGRKLLMSASQIATKLKYERAVETAEDALVQLG